MTPEERALEIESLELRLMLGQLRGEPIESLADAMAGEFIDLVDQPELSDAAVERIMADALTNYVGDMIELRPCPECSGQCGYNTSTAEWACACCDAAGRGDYCERQRMRGGHA